jgi:hypothetical protein
MIDYDITLRCSYKSEDKTDDDYRKDLLTAFKLTEWNGDKVNATCESLWHKMSHDSNFCKLMEKSPFYNADDIITSFMGLFNYDQFDIIHDCICEVLIKNELSTTEYNNALSRME